MSKSIYSDVLTYLRFFTNNVKQYQPYDHCKQPQAHWCEDGQQKLLAHNRIVAMNNDAGTKNTLMQVQFKTVYSFL
jgi:hypothetical protein